MPTALRRKQVRRFAASGARLRKPFSVRTNSDSIVVSFDRKQVSAKEVNRLLECLRFEDLCRKADFDPSIVALGERMKAEWWARNGKRFLEEPAR